MVHIALCIAAIRCMRQQRKDAVFRVQERGFHILQETPWGPKGISHIRLSTFYHQSTSDQRPCHRYALSMHSPRYRVQYAGAGTNQARFQAMHYAIRDTQALCSVEPT